MIIFGIIEMEVNQDVIDYKNYAYSQEVIYWRKAALESIFNQERRKKIHRLNTSNVSLIRKVKIVKTVCIYKIFT